MCPYFSFVIPVFNVEEYLNQCVDSILSQSFQDIEIILIDDGSFDNSSAICDLYTQNDYRIKVIHRKNAGLSSARNQGIRMAVGKYVIFVDSDDFWINNYDLEFLVNSIEDLEGECDFIGYNCCYYYTNSGTFKRWKSYSQGLTDSFSKSIIIPYLVKSGTFPMSACLKVVKRDLLLMNRLYFIENIYHEDIPWFLELLNKSEKIVFVNRYIYAYRRGVNGSITSSFSKKKYNDLFYVLKWCIDFVEKIDEEIIVKESLLSFCAYEYCILLGMLGKLSGDDRNEERGKLYKYEWLLKYTMNPKVRTVAICRKVLGKTICEFLVKTYMNQIA